MANAFRHIRIHYGTSGPRRKPSLIRTFVNSFNSSKHSILSPTITEIPLFSNTSSFWMCLNPSVQPKYSSVNQWSSIDYPAALAAKETASLAQKNAFTVMGRMTNATQMDATWTRHVRTVSSRPVSDPILGCYLDCCPRCCLLPRAAECGRTE